MLRVVTVFAVFAAAQFALAAPPAGSWKFSLSGAKSPIIFLVNFNQADGKWNADVVDCSAKLEPKFTAFTVKDDTVKFTLALNAETVMNFDGLVSKDGKTLKGSYGFGGDAMRTIDISPSTLKNLTDSFEVAKESLGQTEDADLALDYAKDVLKQAAAKKMTADEVRAMLDRVGKLAAAHGRRWERYAILKLGEVLVTQEGLAEVALAQARKAERMLADDDDATVRMATLEFLVRSLLAAKKMDEAKPYQTQLLKLEALEYQTWAKTNPAFKVEEFKARKAPNDRVVLVELFSCAEFDPSAAIDAARDGILKAYKPTEVIALTYHFTMNPDEMDVLATSDGMDRVRGQIAQIQRGQHAFVAGKPSVGIAPTTKLADAESIFNGLRDRINTELELPAKAKLTLTVTSDRDGYTAKANVTDLAAPGEKVFLRFALVEDRMRHTGSNGAKFHQMVVRALPGGANGFPLKAASQEQTVSIKLADLKSGIAKYLAERGAEGSADKVTSFKNLKLIAFIQNEATGGDILTAAIADLK